VQSGGVTVQDTITSGGIVRLSSGAVASGASVLAGGSQNVAKGALASGTQLSGKEFVYGRTSNTVVRSGGRELVNSGAVAVGAVVSGGGTLIVSAGGALSGGLILHGGKAQISGAMAAGQTVTFAGAGVLELDNLAGFAAKISGLSAPAEKIDLGGFAFSAGETRTWTQSGTSGTLIVHDGAKTASLALIGTYTTGDFHLATDSHGGTYVTDPRPAPETVRLAQTAAGLAGGRGYATLATAQGGWAAGSVPVVVKAMSGR
jgi:autotransporter passenger strand-loop-strand repeat protein